MNRFAKLSVAASLVATAAFAFHATNVQADAPYGGSKFKDVWGQVASDPYPYLPHYAVTVGSFFGFFQNKIFDSASRTLSSKSDLLPRFQKLVHPNGICLSGTWNITEKTPYTGYFRQGSKALFIARASTALTATEQGQYRAFGFAGKLFPTSDPNAQVKTANFFTIEDLGGTLKSSFLDAVNTNDIFHVSLTPTTFMSTPVGLAAGNAFMAADKTFDASQTLVRQLYPISELGERDPSKAVTPRWLSITGAADVPRIDIDDFRDELRVSNYPKGLRFDIRTADVGTRAGAKEWRKIGYVEITQDAVSDSCDHRLHFAHPTFRK